MFGWLTGRRKAAAAPRAPIRVDAASIIVHEGPASRFREAVVPLSVGKDAPYQWLYYGDDHIEFAYDGFLDTSGDRPRFVVDKLTLPAGLTWPFSRAAGKRARRNLRWLHNREGRDEVVFNFPFEAPVARGVRGFTASVPGMEEGWGGTLVTPRGETIMVLYLPRKARPGQSPLNHFEEGMLHLYADRHIQVCFRKDGNSLSGVQMWALTRHEGDRPQTGLITEDQMRRLKTDLEWVFGTFRFTPKGFSRLPFADRPKVFRFNFEPPRKAGLFDAWSDKARAVRSGPAKTLGYTRLGEAACIGLAALMAAGVLPFWGQDTSLLWQAALRAFQPATVAAVVGAGLGFIVGTTQVYGPPAKRWTVAGGFVFSSALAGFLLAAAVMQILPDPTPRVPVARLTPMTGKAVNELLSNVAIGGPCCEADIVFDGHGGYIKDGYARQSGRYTIEGNQACGTFNIYTIGENLDPPV